MCNSRPSHPKLLTRFLKKIKVDPDTDCWMWKRSTDKDGYAHFWYEGSCRRGHRWAYQVVFGITLLPWIYARHTCDRPGCVNPFHIKPGSAKANSDDKVRKGRQASKLSARDVWQMRCLYDLGAYTYAGLGRIFGVTPSASRQAVTGATWKRVPHVRDVLPGTAPMFDANGVLSPVPSAIQKKAA